eukprot:TRINITY_DN3982_c1_g1_i1.p1 TRINITY_DN3982_c1_g1~~TRINITY_DN3982_c1_g1_i1.p1  ORF type:complete len:922 (+),score=459.62 TRINITY_DN3982_c1_g1_i1:81-2846(+)
MQNFNAQTFRPENAVRRAKELLAQDQPGMALKALQDIIRNRRNRIWTPTHEEIMMMIVDLSVELRRNIKDDLIHYRGLAALANVNSFENVIVALVEKGEAKARAAKEASESRAEVLRSAEQVDEEEAAAELGLGDETPEAIILKTVSQEESKDRITREHLTPWLRYLNECYRTSLEICNRNAKLETVFHQTAIRAFNFCLEYKQKQWFRNHGVRLLRDHLNQAMHSQNRQQQEHRSNMLLQNPEVFNVMVEARFKQLDVAVKFDSWQHAFQAIEDIHSLIKYFKRVPKNSMMLDYWKQLANIFWESKNWLFHSHSLIKLFSLSKQKKDLKEEEARHLASRVILAVLCIPFWNHEPPTRLSPFLQDLEREKAAKLTELLGRSTQPPTRVMLMHEMLKKDPKNQGVMNCADKEIIELYNIIEGNVQPLTLGDQLQPILQWLRDSDLGQYIGHIQQVAAVSVIVQVSRVYSSISLDSLKQMCRFYTEDLEALLVAVARSEANDVQMVIDHQSRAVHFEDADVSPAIISSALPCLRRDFSVIHRMLVNRGEDKKVQDQEVQQYQKLLLKRVRSFQEQERKDVLRRKAIIEKRKEKAEQRQLEKIKARQLTEREEREKTRVMEQEKVEKEREKRQQKEEEEKEKQKEKEVTMRLVTVMKDTQNIGAQTAKRLQGEEGPRSLDEVKQDLVKLMLQQKEKEEQRRLEEWQKVHWWERAAREMETPMIREEFKRRQEQQRKDHEARIANAKAQARKDWEDAMETRKRLSRMDEHLEAFRERVLQDRLIRAKAWAERKLQEDEAHSNLMAQTGRTDSAAAGVKLQTKDAEEERSPTPSPKAASPPAAAAAAPAAADAGAEAPKKAWQPKHKRAGGGSMPPADEPAAAAPAAPEAAAPAPDEAPAPAPAAEEAPKKQAWGAARKGAFKVEL